jgi:hypothetical protein
MTIFQDLRIGEVYAFVTNMGQEILGELADVTEDVIRLRKPRILMPTMEVDPRTGAQNLRVGLMPFTHSNRDETFPTPFVRSSFMSVVLPHDDARKGYLSQTSSIAIV